MMSVITRALGAMLLGTIVIAHAEPENHQFGQFQYIIDPDIPTWVTMPKLEKHSDKPADQGARYVLVDDQVLDEPNNQQYFNRMVIDLETSQAVATESELSFGFSPEYQQLVIHHIDVIRNGKATSRLNPNAIRLLQREEDLRNGIYTGLVSALIFLPDVRVNDRLDIAYSVKGKNPVYDNKVFGSTPVGWGVYVDHRHVRVLVPKDIPIYSAHHSTDIPFKSKVKGAYRELVWDAKQIPAIISEEEFPSSYIQYPWLEYSQFKTWAEVQQWADSVYSDVDTVIKQNNDDSSSSQGSAVEKLATEIGLDKSPLDFAKDAVAFVQNEVRYLGMEIGVNSHKPHSPDEVLAQRYGDCKDKSVLLASLLRQRGINAHPALVSSQFREGIGGFLPRPSVFDHVIVKATIDGAEFWIDGTRTFQQGPLTEHGFTPFGKALVVGDNSGDLSTVNHWQSQIDSMAGYDHYIVKAFDKPVQLKVVTVTKGNMAEYNRALFSSSSRDELQRRYLDYYKRLYPSATVSAPMKIVDDPHSNRFQIEEYYDIPDFFEAKNRNYSGYYVATTITENLQKPKNLERSSPYFVGRQAKLSHKIVVDFPEDVGLDFDGAPYSRSIDKISFDARDAYYDNRYEFNVDVEIKDPVIEAEKLGEYLKFLDTIEDDVNFSLNFQLPPNDPNLATYNRLLDRLHQIVGSKR